MLMDLFTRPRLSAPAAPPFHEFMAEVHERIASVADARGRPDPACGRQDRDQGALLCFDELHVTDIADAMILGRLFRTFFGADRRVATSNVSPGELYKNGLNRQLFLPFIDLIEDHIDVIELKAAKDFAWKSSPDGHSISRPPTRRPVLSWTSIGSG